MAVDAEIGSDSVAPANEPDDRTVDKNRQFLRLFLQNQRRLYAYILTLLPNRADADDVLQEASLVMWDKFDEDNPPADFAVGRGFAYHKVLDFYKKAEREGRLSRVFVQRSPRRRGAGRWAATRRARRRPRCVEKLTPRDRDLLARRFADGATTQATRSRSAGRWTRCTGARQAPRNALRLRPEIAGPEGGEDGTR